MDVSIRGERFGKLVVVGPSSEISMVATRCFAGVIAGK